MNKEVSDALTELLNIELGSAYLHLAVSAAKKDFVFINILRGFFTEQQKKKSNTKAAAGRQKPAGNSHNTIWSIGSEPAARTKAVPRPTKSMMLPVASSRGA